jgi:hypothetical protein
MLVNQVQEEGWRNRLESIEAIDLRDSESQINKAYNENKIDTLGFRLANNKVTIEDSDGSIHSLYTSAGSSTLIGKPSWRFITSIELSKYSLIR